MSTTVEFTEEMHGPVALGESDPQQSAASGQPMLLHLTIRTEDIDLFLADPRHKGSVTGYVTYAPLGSERPITGEFDCLVEAANNSRVMLYRLSFTADNGVPYRINGEKKVCHDGIEHIWRDTTTLFTVVSREGNHGAPQMGAGILRLGPLDFMKQLTTFRAEGDSLAAEIEAIEKFGMFFLGELWKVYKPRQGSISSHNKERHIPIFTMSGVKNAEISTIHISTPDYLGLNIFRFLREPCRDVVVLLHGLTTSTDMFIMPEHYNLVSYLLDNGYTDVWSFDWRGSMRYSYDLFPANFTMDDIALYDMPAAFAKIRHILGREARIHVICHCVGSLTFMMSLSAGLVDGISSVISNSVSLTPRVPKWCRIKLAAAPFLFVESTDFNPRWSYYPGVFSYYKWLSRWISLWHRECDVPACHVVSFMWGSGHPAAWMHQNLDEMTHKRTGDLFGSVNVNYYRHIRKMVKAGAAIKMYPDNSAYKRLPDNYLQSARTLDTPILFVTGENNNVFMNSNIVAYEEIAKLNPNSHNELRVFPGYGHQDPFMGKNSAREIFPAFLGFLRQYSCDAATRVVQPEVTAR